MLRFAKSMTALVLTLMLGVVGCESNSGTDDNTYAGPGSFYTMDLDSDNTFSVTIAEDPTSAVHTTVTGTYELLSTGFLLLTVGAVESDEEDGPSVGDQAFAILVEGTVAFLKPLDNDSEIIPMLVAGSCPDADFQANWFIAQGDDEEKNYTESQQEAAGGFAYDFDNNEATVTSDYNLVDFSATGNVNNAAFDTVSCENGIMQLTEDGNVIANMFLTAVGGAIVETFDEDEENPGQMVRNSTIVALPKEEMSAKSDLAGDYAALVFTSDDEEEGSGDNIFPLALTLDENGVGTGSPLSNVETGAVEEGEEATINLSGDINSPENGFVTGTVTADDSGNVICSFLADANGSGKKVLVCTGQDPGENSRPYLLLAVENS